MRQMKPIKREILRNYKSTYFARDLLLLSNIESADGLLAIMSYLCVAIGSHTDVSNAAKESGLSHPTTKKYINVLESSRLLFKVYGFHYGPAKRFTRAAKHYFADSGIATALGVSLSAGQRLEQFVISELEKRRKLGLIDCEHLLYYKSSGGFEIDVIIDEPDCITAIEIKATSKPDRKDARNVERFLAELDCKKAKRGIVFHLERILSLVEM